MASLSAVTKFVSKRVTRVPLDLVLRNLVSWGPLDDPVEGYSVAIACMRRLSPVAIANMMFCLRTNHARMREVILVFDCPADQVPEAVTRAVRETDSSVPVSVLGYDERQHRVAQRVNWGWVFSWLSWCLAIRHARTRALIIHDLDALPLSPNLFEELYDNWLEEGAEFCGISRYRGNGVDEEMGLVPTFELTLDTAYLRRTFRPYDLFNKIRIVHGRAVEFDTMLLAQWQSPRRAFRPIDQTQLFHPTQLICQHTELVSGRTDFRGRDHSLPILLYLMYLGGDPTPMTSVTPLLAEASTRSFPMLGREAYIDGVTPQAWAWFEKQIRRIEQNLFGETRPEVASYLRGIIQRAGAHRSVGVESGALAVPER